MAVRFALSIESRLLTLLRLLLFGRVSIVARDRFLRKQLAQFQEREVRPRRAKATTRLAMLALADRRRTGADIQYARRAVRGRRSANQQPATCLGDHVTNERPFQCHQ